MLSFSSLDRFSMAFVYCLQVRSTSIPTLPPAQAKTYSTSLCSYSLRSHLSRPASQPGPFFSSPSSYGPPACPSSDSYTGQSGGRCHRLLQRPFAELNGAFLQGGVSRLPGVVGGVTFCSNVITDISYPRGSHYSALHLAVHVFLQYFFRSSFQHLFCLLFLFLFLNLSLN